LEALDMHPRGREITRGAFAMAEEFLI
jgi:hypothetical protein